MPTFHSKRAPVNWEALVARTRSLTAEERRAHSSSSPPTFEFMVTTIEQDAARSSSDIHLFGVTRAGDTVHCTVTDFRASFFIEMPPELHVNDLETVRVLWNAAIDRERRFPSRFDPIYALSVHRRESLMYYKGGPDLTRDGRQNFIRVDLGCPSDTRDVRDFFAGKLGRGGAIALPHGAHRRTLAMYEEDGLKFLEQFQRTKRVCGFGWATIEHHTLDRRSLSTCTWDVSVSCEHLTAHRSDENPELYGAIAPLRVATFDIECEATTRAFPAPHRDPVIQIAVHIKEYSTAGERMVLDTVLALGEVESFEDDDNTVLSCYETERELLLSFSRLLLAADYDISRGYNQRTFDWPYLFDRAATLGIDEEFTAFSRLRSVPARIKPEGDGGSQFGDTRDPDVPGRCDFDVLSVVRENYKFRGYKLNNVSLEVLEKTKEDVHHSMIGVLQRGSPSDRRRLASYCRKDALLPALIDEKLLLLVRYIELARVSGITLETLTRYAQQARVIAALAGIANEFGFLLPLGQQLTPFTPEGQFDGGLVLEPVVGFHDDAPTVCLDFSSLYPSLGLAHNTDYTTLLRPEDVASMRPEDYERSEDGHAFVRRHVRKGLLQVLWERTLAARNVAKADMKACLKRAAECAASGDVAGEKEWTFKASVQDARQQALKLLGNAAYGFTGVRRERGGKLSAFEIPSAITSYGRQALRRVCSWVNREFPSATIVYGDTDSVMVKPGCKTVPEAFSWMRMAAERITREEFGNEAPMKLAPEKVMFPMLSIAKKRYIDGYWEKSETKPDKVHYRGVEVVRRDSCELMATCLERCCEFIFIKRDVEAAIQCAKDVVQRLYLNQVNMSELLMSKTLSMPPEKYANAQPHSALTLKMMRRDPSTAPVVGERVAYVMTGSGVDSIAELAEDPLYALEHEIPINVRYYIERQLQKPLERLFVPIIGESRTAAIFSGDHTRKRVRPQAPRSDKKATAGIMAFVTVMRSCQKCRTAYDPNVHKHPSLCAACVDEHGEAASDEKRARHTDIKARYDAQMQVCRTCQGSDRDPVLCMARDCRELYKRKDLERQCQRAEADMEDMVVMKKARRE